VDLAKPQGHGRSVLVQFRQSRRGVVDDRSFNFAKVAGERSASPRAVKLGR
jgi:hypothetical protein